MATDVPLHVPLSQTLVAFTIECDNLAEARIPHSTTRHGSTTSAQPGPWLTSLAMYLNCMQFLDNGISARELVRAARARTNFHGMLRWGYITIRPDPSSGRPAPPKAEWIVRPTEAGRNAKETWRPLTGEVEERWKQRFGGRQVTQLIASLAAVEQQFDLDLPDCLPILGYGLYSNTAKYRKRTARSSEARLPVLLARVLLVYALEFEAKSELSLAISANALRVLQDDGVPVRLLPRLAGISKEAMAVAMNFFVKRGYADVKTDSSRAKVARLTEKGLKAKAAYSKQAQEVEVEWHQRFGQAIDDLRKSIDPIVGNGVVGSCPLFAGLEPPPNGWRAEVPGPQTLPHFPVVSHRGGYPDGS